MSANGFTELRIVHTMEKMRHLSHFKAERVGIRPTARLSWLASMAMLALQLCAFSTAAQNKRTSFQTKSEVRWAGVDRAGDLFLVLNSGEVQKFTKEGNQVGSHQFDVPPTLLDPMDGAQSFYFGQKGNVYGNLSSDLQTVTNKLVDPAFAITPWLVSPSLHELWILDSADLSIKKTKLNSATLSLETALKHLPNKSAKDYTYMREYQNYLFLLDVKAGVHMFNSLGMFVRTFGEKGLEYFAFMGEEIYFIKGNELVLVDLYTQETRKIRLPLPCIYALLNDDTLYAVDRGAVTIFEFKP